MIQIKSTTTSAAPDHSEGNQVISTVTTVDLSGEAGAEPISVTTRTSTNLHEDQSHDVSAAPTEETTQAQTPTAAAADETINSEIAAHNLESEHSEAAEKHQQPNSETVKQAEIAN